jgi:hypothetical protein
VNPGAGRIRLSLVANIDETREALERLAGFIQQRRTHQGAFAPS